MVKVIGTIVNEQMSLVGLVIEGPAKEFGGIGDNVVSKPMTVQYLDKVKFKNRQVEVKNNSVIQKNGTQLKELPAQMYKDGALHNIDNSIKLVARITVNGKVVGYDAIVAGNKMRLRTENVVALSNWMHSVNFITRYTSDNKAFVAGRVGESVENLPVVELSAKKEKVKHEAKVDASKNIVKPEVKKTLDMLELMQLINSVGGKIIFLPTETYNKTNVADRKVAEGFVKFGAGEIGAPYINPAEKSLNVNSKFSCIGTVAVQLSTGLATLYPYTQTTKTIFRNGKNHVGKFGIAIQGDDVERVVNELGKALVLEPLTTPMVIQPLRAFMQDTTGSVKFFTVDTSNIEALSEEHAAKCIMSNKEIRRVALELLAEKSIYAYVNGASKAAYDKLKITSSASARGTIYQPYQSLSESDLKILEENGINIYTGAYVKTEKTDERTTADAERTRKLALGEDVVEKELGWEVEYMIDRCSKSLSFKDIAEGKNSALYENIPDLADRLDAVVVALNKATNEKEVYDIAEPLKKECDRRKAELVRQLWLNNMARLRFGGYTSFKLDNFDEVKELSACMVYRCNESGAEDLGVKITKSLPISK